MEILPDDRRPPRLQRLSLKPQSMEILEGLLPSLTARDGRGRGLRLTAWIVGTDGGAVAEAIGVGIKLDCAISNLTQLLEDCV